MPVTDARSEAIGRTLEALHAQTTDRWSLTAVADEARLRDAGAALRASTPRRSRRRVRSVAAAAGATAADLLRTGIAAHQGENLALIFPGDVWAPDAVALLSGALTPTGVVYADEDRLAPDGTHTAPRLKPGYSPEFLLSSSYVGRPLAIGAGLTAARPHPDASGLAELEHAYALSACEAADVGDPCRGGALPPIGRRGAACVRGAPRAGGARRPERAGIRHGRSGAGNLSRAPTADGGAGVSILIPFRDEPRLLRTCVDSVTGTTRGEQVELVLIDNGSSDPETMTLVDHLEGRADVRVLRDARPFNWAGLNNAAVRVAKGDVLVFLNNDIEAHRSGWLSALCAQAQRPDVGGVGARLLYPDRRLQHCGLVVGLTGAAGHPLAGLPADATGYLHMAALARECSAVTGACLATRRDVFDRLGGFDETLGVDLNDVDFCLRAGVEGLRTLYEPAAELIHHESPSRGTAGGVGDIVHFVDRWKDYITEGDRYFNPHLTRADPSCGLAGAEEEDAWNRWYSTLTTQ